MDADQIVRESAISSLMQLFRAQAEWGPSWTPIYTSWSVEGEFQGTMSEEIPGRDYATHMQPGNRWLLHSLNLFM